MSRVAFSRMAALLAALSCVVPVSTAHAEEIRYVLNAPQSAAIGAHSRFAVVDRSGKLLFRGDSAHELADGEFKHGFLKIRADNHLTSWPVGGLALILGPVDPATRTRPSGVIDCKGGFLTGKAQASGNRRVLVRDGALCARLPVVVRRLVGERLAHYGLAGTTIYVWKSSLRSLALAGLAGWVVVLLWLQAAGFMERTYDGECR